MGLQTISTALAHAAALTPHKPAIYWQHQIWSYALLDEQVNRLSNVFLHASSNGAPYVACFLGKRPEFVVTFLSCGRAGLVYVPCNPLSHLGTLQSQLLDAPPSWIVVDDVSLDRIVSVTDQIGIKSKFLVLSHKQGVGSMFLDWETALRAAPPTAPMIDVTPQHYAYLNATSGTTGIPKFVVTTHENLYWNVRAATEKLGLTESDVHLCTFPPYLHPHETLARSIFLAGAMFLSESTVDDVWRALQTGLISCVMSNPSLCHLLAQHAHARAGKFGPVRLFESGGSPSSRALINTYRYEFGCAFATVWGSTETTGIALAATEYRDDMPDGLLGSPCPYYYLNVVDEHGDPVPPGHVGQLIVQGPAVARGYLKVRPTDESRFRDGWCWTGDSVSKQDDVFYFVGRADHTIKSGGLKVHPEEIESLLMHHPAISDVGIIGVADPIRGQIVKAVIVPKPGYSITQRDVVTFCHQHLDNFKVPRLVRFVSTLPRTESGKLVRSNLTDID